VFNHDTDGLGTRFGGCRAKYRNRGNKVGVKVIYQHDSLRVLLDMRNNGVWERCLVKDNIYLAAGSYFGFSAANQAESEGDEIKVLSFKVRECREGGDCAQYNPQCCTTPCCLPAITSHACMLTPWSTNIV